MIMRVYFFNFFIIITLLLYFITLTSAKKFNPNNDVNTFINNYINKKKKYDNNPILKLDDTKISSCCIFYHYIQYLNNDISIYEHGLIIKEYKLNKSKKIIYENIYNPKDISISTYISKDIALNNAWEYLDIHNYDINKQELYNLPTIKLILKVYSNNHYELIYQIKISINQPHGTWYIELNAKNGQIKKHKNMNSYLYEHEHENLFF